MNVKVIKLENEYQEALQRIEALMDTAPGSSEEEELELISLLVEKYEEEHYPIELPDPIEAILFRMDQQGLSAKDMIPYLGSQSRVSEVLNRKRSLSMTMVRKLHEGLGIPLESLIQDQSREWREDLEKEKSQFTKLAKYFSCGHLDNASKTDKIEEWYWKVINKAKKEVLPTFDWNKMDPSLFEELFRFCSYSAGPKMARELLQRKGIHLIVQRIDNDIELDGACFILPEINPVVSMTLENNRADDFWMTLFHLVSHLYLHKGEQSLAIFDSMECAYEPNAPVEENRVNQFLKDFVVNWEGLGKTWQYYQEGLDALSKNQPIEDSDINLDLLSCLYRIETEEKKEAISQASKRKVSDKLEVYTA